MGSIINTTIGKSKLIIDQYDPFGHEHVLEYHKEFDKFNSIIWGYNDNYQVVIGENVEYEVLNTAVSAACGGILEYFLATSIGDLNTTEQKNQWKAFNTALRNDASLSNALITTYTYIPLVGMSSMTDPSGITTYYEYDSFGRLIYEKDDKANIVKQYDYHYAGQ